MWNCERDVTKWRRLCTTVFYKFMVHHSLATADHTEFDTAIWLTNHCVSPHAIYSLHRIHYKLRHASQQNSWITLNCKTIMNQKKLCGDLLAEHEMPSPAFTSALLQDLLSLCHTVTRHTHGWAASVARSPKKCPLNFQHW